MKYIVTVNDNNYEVDVDRGQASVIKTCNAPQAAPEAAEALKAASAAAQQPQSAAAQGEKLTAPMPGIVLQVKKSVGDAVKKGDVIIVLEAMKMESEITSPFEGDVVQLSASTGMHVNAGDVLAVIR